ncbi:MAG TPA: DUF1232 domain-containing protein [Cyclobacteriaceae bacterium]|nr:DUF1232 domain-containing protein [Cyclobacteriaceae bacterium]HRJ81393.1 DUF1232 domain-containing protein [Cyclobacteriaceae bacterium]
MTNIFYQSALQLASGLFGRHGRVALLLSQLAMKMGRMNKNDLSFTAAKSKLDVMVRLVKAYTKGQYKGIPWKTIATVLAAFIYFVNPFDLIPDIAPVVGFTDDFSILVWVYSSVQIEVNKFLAWEQTQLTVA